MASRFTPVNQKRLTNVTVVRLKKAGKRFEIACYPNKVNSWKNKIESNLDEVLQSVTVFSNVSKGQLASSQDLTKAFDSTDQLEICLKILEKGELQVTEKERDAAAQQMLKDIVSMLSVMILNPDTNRPYTQAMIERALKDSHFKVKPNQTAKQQALEAMKILQSTGNLKIKRADMRIRVTLRGTDMEGMKDKIKKVGEVESEDCVEGDCIKLVLLLNTSEYKEVQKIVGSNHDDNSTSIDLLAFQDITSDCQDVTE